MAARQQTVIGNDQWTVSNQRAMDEQKDKDLRNRLMQGAAMAMKMNDQTALGYGLGTLLFNNWDKWFGGGKEKADEGNGDKNPYDFSKNMTAAQDPMQFAINGGDPHAAWAAEHNQPFSLVALQQNPSAIGAAPLPGNYTIGGMNPQTVANPAQTGLQAGVPLTQQFTINGQNAGDFDPNKAMMYSNMNPANFDNYAKANGLMGGLGAVAKSETNLDNWQEELKKALGMM